MNDEFVPQPLASDLPAGTTVGEYTIERKLGDGGMATVYGATHPLIGKKAAIKVMNPSLSVDAGLVERFILEARAVNAIGHHNIVDVFSFGRLDDGRSYFVMEWLPGETLYDRLYDRQLGVDEALDIMDQICDALEAAHDKGIVHRDLKPANIFLCPVRGRRDLVKLLDFGVAKLMHPEAAGDALPLSPSTLRGHVVGTPDYISPEQARAKKVDGKTDVYALGVIAYEMLFGRKPFEADNAADLVRLHLSEPPPSPRSLWPEIPAPLDELLTAMLQKTAAKRPSAAEVRQTIRELRGTPPPFEWDAAPPSLPKMTKPPTPTPNVTPLPPPGGLRRLGVRAGALALVGLGAGAVMAIGWRAEPPSPPPVSASATAVSPPATAPSPETTAPSPPKTTPSPAKTPEGTLVVRVDADDARIDLDGRLLAESAAGARVTVAPGDHTLTVTAAGRQRWAGRVVVDGGRTSDVTVRLKRLAASRAPSVRTPPARTATARASATKPAVPSSPSRKDPDYLVDPFGAPR